MTDDGPVSRPTAAEQRWSARRDWASARLRIENSRYRVSPLGRYRRWPARLLHRVLDAACWGFRLAGLAARGRRNALAPQLAEVELQFETLPPPFDGFRILHLSDTHLDALPGLAEIAAGRLAGVEADLIVVSGDVVGRAGTPPPRAVAPLARVLSGVRLHGRRLAVLGNHDTAATADALEEAGFEVLLNETVAIGRGEAAILVTGLDDVHAFYTEAASRALERAFDGFRIAIIHSGELADRASAAGVQLYLCGHTHGGQICLPGGRPLVTQLKRCAYAASGLWRDGAMLGYTSRGLGISGHPLRFNCPGEMTLLTLRSAAPRRDMPTGARQASRSPRD